VLRQRGQELGVFFEAEWKRGQSFLEDEKGIIPGDPNRGESTVAVLRTGADYLLRLQRRAIAARITANFGIDALDATDNSEDEEFSDGEFVTGLFQIQLVEYLPWYGLRLQSRLDAQVADGDLLGLEQFAIGGHATVRGFRENLVVRDEGVVGSLELRIPLPLVDPIERLEFGVFTDVGYGRYLDQPDSLAATLVSLGIGVHADITRYVRASIEWAADLKESGARTGNELQDDGLHFSLQVRFP
ncbi:MAG: ShlB/FhaC/HecB family hemolysin secretion/activation protein, partial [Deltaproteobacteria bacterium]|nr:ShlB/FhaC/HecB family hemolysin secretion/activation protein [Deltaproteobacteria bacterium]